MSHDGDFTDLTVVAEQRTRVRDTHHNHLSSSCVIDVLKELLKEVIKEVIKEEAGAPATSCRRRGGVRRRRAS